MSEAKGVEPLLVFPDPPPPLLAQTLDLAGYPWKAVENAAIAVQHEPRDGWAGAVVVADEDPEGAFGICRALRKRDAPLEPVLLLISGAQLSELELREDLFDDFCLTPFHPKELEARMRHQFWRSGRGTRPRSSSTATSCSTLRPTRPRSGTGRSISPTWSTSCSSSSRPTRARCSPGSSCSRECWGYEYYGGARTVDVHVRRLRAKLGEEHANLIQTVRSVGYRFGQPRALVGR